jgi:acetyl esterase/lipase
MSDANRYNLEKPAAEVAAYLSQGPPLYELPLADLRKAVDGAPGGDAASMPNVEEAWFTVPADVGDVRVLIIKPGGAKAPLPVVLYMHGGGWVLGSASSHGRLAAELAVAGDAAVAFVDYALAPEARYPVQIEQCYAVARWVTEQGASHGLDPSRLAVAGDSAGGNMATVLCIMARQRGDVNFVQQSMYYPMTDAVTDEDSESYRLFKDGPYGTAATMEWLTHTFRSRASASRAPSPRCRHRSTSSAACRPLWSSSTRTTSSETRARRTRPSCATPMCQPRASVSTAPCTTS